MCLQFKRDLFQFPALDFIVILGSILYIILISYLVLICKIDELPHFYAHINIFLILILVCKMEIETVST